MKLSNRLIATATAAALVFSGVTVAGAAETTTTTTATATTTAAASTTAAATTTMLPATVTSQPSGSSGSKSLSSLWKSGDREGFKDRLMDWMAVITTVAGLITAVMSIANVGKKFVDNFFPAPAPAPAPVAH